MNTTEKEGWDKIIQKYISCTCGEIYLSRDLTAPDCPYHANDWESPMEEFLKELKEQQAEQIGLHEKTLDITTDQLMGVQAERNELKEEPKGLRWVKAEDRNPTKEGMHICIVSVKDKGLIYEPVSYMGFYSGAWRKNLNGAPCTIIKWLEETPLEAAQNIKP